VASIWANCLQVRLPTIAATRSQEDLARNLSSAVCTPLANQKWHSPFCQTFLDFYPVLRNPQSSYRKRNSVPVRLDRVHVHHVDESHGGIQGSKHQKELRCTKRRIYAYWPFILHTKNELQRRSQEWRRRTARYTDNPRLQHVLSLPDTLRRFLRLPRAHRKLRLEEQEPGL
jgi:hypothetical protein